jgi:peptide/nickel transport system substrate-binding protein
MRRRTLLQATPALLAAPRIASAQNSARTLRFVPQGNLANIDPIWTTTVIARNHALMIYDTLFGRTCSSPVSVRPVGRHRQSP